MKLREKSIVYNAVFRLDLGMNATYAATHSGETVCDHVSVARTLNTGSEQFMKLST